MNSRYPNQFLELYQLFRGAWPATFDQKCSTELGPSLLVKFAQFTLLTLGLFGFVPQRLEPFATISSFQSLLQYNYLRAIHITNVH